MSVLSLRLPNSLHEQVREMAQAEGISMNQFVALAVAEKVAVLQASDYLAQRGRHGSREKLLAVLAKTPAAQPSDSPRHQRIGERNESPRPASPPGEIKERPQLRHDKIVTAIESVY
jgi:hypothetical protein